MINNILLTTWTNYLIPLQIVVPLFIACLLVFIKNPKLSYAIVIIGLLSSSSISIGLIIVTQKLGDVSYVFGGFSAELGIEYRITNIGAIILLIINLLGLINFVNGYPVKLLEVSKSKIHTFDLLYLIFCVGIMGLVMTFDLFNIFVFLEISSIASYTLISLNNKDKTSSFFAFNYLIIGSVAASIYILAVGIIYLLTGSLNMDIVFKSIPELTNIKPIILSCILVILFIAIKIGLFPFSAWIPRTYSAAPLSFSPLLASINSKIIVFSFSKIILALIIVLSPSKLDIFRDIILIGSIISLIVSSIIPFTINGIKSILGWSTVSTTALLVLGMLVINPINLPMIVLLILSQVFAKGGLFMFASYINKVTGNTKLSNLHQFDIIGNKIIFLSFGILAATIIGIPGTVGFTAKWLLIVSLFDSHFYITGLVVIITSLTSLGYMWLIIENMTFHKKNNIKTQLNNTLENITISFMAVLCVGFSLFSSQIINCLR